MGRLVVTEFMTLDGVAQAPGGRDEDREDGFDHGGWQAPFMDQAAGAALFDEAASMDALLLGRRTYDIFAAFWPNAPEASPWTALLNGVQKYVASRTLAEPLAWQRSSLLSGDLRAAVMGLKERHDEVHVIGSLDLAQSLLRHDLVDQLDLWVYPVLLGTGKRLFAGGTVPRALRLTDSKAYDNGSVHLRYDNAGEPSYGDMTAEA